MSLAAQNIILNVIGGQFVERWPELEENLFPATRKKIEVRKTPADSHPYVPLALAQSQVPCRFLALLRLACQPGVAAD